MNVHDRAPVVGRLVRDRHGRRVGRVVAIDYARTRRSEVWFLVRLYWRRDQFRAIPASIVRWDDDLGSGAELRVDLDLAQVADSPALSRRTGVHRKVLVAYYGDPSRTVRA